MEAPSILKLCFLAYVLVFMPWAAWRTAQRLKPRAAASTVTPATPATPPAPVITRTRVLVSTLVSLALMSLASWITAREFGYDLFWSPPLGVRELLAAVVALAAALGVMFTVRTFRTEQERRSMAIRAWMPRSPGEWLLYLLTAVGAGIAEESAYRGVAVWILTGLLGSPWPAVLLSVLAFSLAHVVQGWKSMLAIAAIALLFHALVWITGTLVLAMVVHAVYDVIAGRLASRRFERQDRQDERDRLARQSVPAQESVPPATPAGAAPSEPAP